MLQRQNLSAALLVSSVIVAISMVSAQPGLGQRAVSQPRRTLADKIEESLKDKTFSINGSDTYRLIEVGADYFSCQRIAESGAGTITIFAFDAMRGMSQYPDGSLNVYDNSIMELRGYTAEKLLKAVTQRELSIHLELKPESAGRPSKITGTATPKADH